MIHQLEKIEFKKARPLFEAMNYNLAAQAILAGTVPGVVYVDDPCAPKSAIARTGHRFYLVGFERNDTFNKGITELFLEKIYPEAIEAGANNFVLYYAPDSWENAIEKMLKGKLPAQVPRRYYVFKELQNDWRELLPPEFTVRPVDGVLLQEQRLNNLDALHKEVLSESPSVEDYLKKRFGFCLVGKDEIVGWCLSEYNRRDRCEVGIETFQAYRRRGIATITASALVEHALAQGVKEIGWHCYASNEGSIATARQVGFEKVRDYPVYYAWFDEILNLAVNGNICFQQKRYTQAIAWYDRALQAGEVPAWVSLNAACANGWVGEKRDALRHLGQAIDKGFTDLEHLKGSKYLSGLHDMPEWQALIGKLERRTRETDQEITYELEKE